MAQVVTINRPDVVALIEQAAEKLRSGNKTAIEFGCPLVTRDDRIRRFGERYGERYGFAVAG
jgi:hypothetical protein